MEEKAESVSKFDAPISTVLNASPNGMIVVNSSGEIVLTNTTLENIFKYSKNEIIGKKIEQLIPTKYKQEHQKYRNHFINRPSPRKMGAGRDLFGLTSDGTEVPIEIGLTPLEYNGKHFVVASVIDISDRKELERTIRIDEIRTTKMIDEINDHAIMELDVSGTILSWNQGAKEIKGYEQEEIIGKNFSVFYKKEDIEENRPSLLLQVAQKKGKAKDEGWRVRKDGSQFWANLTITALHDDKNNIYGFVKVTKDMTQIRIAMEKLEQANQELKHTNAELDDFSYVASHDLKSPLRAISNMAQWIDEDCGHLLPEQSRKDLSELRNRAKRMDTLLNGLLQFSKAGRTQDNYQNINIINLLHDIVDLLDKPKGFQFKIECEIENIHVKSTPFTIVIRNLIHNAIKHHPNDKGEITICCAENTDFYILSISDNGKGIPESQHNKIFGLFKTLNTDEGSGSSGVGLTIVKKIIEKERSTISVKNNSPKPGVTFTVHWKKKN